MNFLSQIRLSSKGDGSKVAKRLIDVYFALFKVFLESMYIVMQVPNTSLLVFKSYMVFLLLTTMHFFWSQINHILYMHKEDANI